MLVSGRAKIILYRALSLDRETHAKSQAGTRQRRRPPEVFRGQAAADRAKRAGDGGDRIAQRQQARGGPAGQRGSGEIRSPGRAYAVPQGKRFWRPFASGLRGRAGEASSAAGPL